MKKLLIFIMFTSMIFAKSSNSTGNSNSGKSNDKGKSEMIEKTTGKKENSKLRDDVAKYNWGQEKTEYTTKEEKIIARETIKHYGNLMKIMYQYKYMITTEEAYKNFVELYESGKIEWDEVTINRLMLEFQRHNGKLTEKEFNDIVVEIELEVKVN